MKKFIAITLLTLLSSSVIASDFCQGYKHGYITGYKQGANISYPPVEPLCPVQPIKNYSDPSSDYEHGYTLGYRKGMNNARRDAWH